MEKNLDRSEREWAGQVKRILAEAKAKSAKNAEESLKDFHDTSAMMHTAFEKIIEVSRHVLEMGELFRKKWAIQESFFGQAGIPQTLKSWQARLIKNGPFPLEESQENKMEKLTILRSRIHDNLFRITVGTGEHERARDSMMKRVDEAAEDAAKKGDKDALLGEIMKVKGDTAEIKDMVKEIKEKDSETTPRERETAIPDLTTSWGVPDEWREAVRTGFSPWE